MLSSYFSWKKRFIFVSKYFSLALWVEKYLIMTHNQLLELPFINHLPTTLEIWSTTGLSALRWHGKYDSIVLRHSHTSLINTLRPRQNWRHFADDTFKRIFLNDNVRISIKISLKFVLKGPINNNPSLVHNPSLAPVRRQAIIWTNDG